MDGIELSAFEMISYSGEAKSLCAEALALAKKSDFSTCLTKIEEAEAMLKIAHAAHAKLIKEEAQGEAVPFSLLLMHAEDQLFGAGEYKVLIVEFIELYKRLEVK